MLEKLGMSFEGWKREQRWVRGHVRTSRVYAILESEYRALGIPVSPWETYSADHTGTTQSTV